MSGMSNLRGSFEVMLSDREDQKVYSFSDDQLDEQLTWMYYVINQVKQNTGEDLSIEAMVIVIREFGMRVQELKERQNE